VLSGVRDVPDDWARFVLGYMRCKEFWADHTFFLEEVPRDLSSMTDQRYAAEAFQWLEKVPSVERGSGVFEVLKSPRRIFQVSLALRHRCAMRKDAAIYIDKIRKGETVLVALLQDGEAQAMGELRFQMHVDTGFDVQFCELLCRRRLFACLRTNCSRGEWDQLMHAVDCDVIKFVKGYGACIPSWVELVEADNRPPRREFHQMFDEAGPQLVQHLLNAWAVMALQVERPRFTCWTIGPRAAVGLGKALAENKAARELDLSGRSVSDEGVCAIAQALHQNETLTALVLAYNDLGDGVTRVLAFAMAANHGLLELSLAHNRVTSIGALLLTKGLACNTSLRLLDLRGNGLPLWVGELDERILI